MNDKKFHITLEILRSITVRYIALTVCIIIIMFFIRKWFIPDKKDVKTTIESLNKLKP